MLLQLANQAHEELIPQTQAAAAVKQGHLQ